MSLTTAARSAMHTAGIYADMTVDGPEIGDLVVILDKAKNLPNRKTIGKQDPYCAARLGKEAKKTETDRRGGQTPKWDQELRFTVHDSPDYYQLKVSVFNDDKKTDLIGETWVNLESVIVRGGGRSDAWHNLNCKGRYAGEIRIELTYYDIRPRDTRQAEPPSQGMRGVEGDREPLGGPRQLKEVKRRPLPADPTSISPATSTYFSPDTVQTPPHGTPVRAYQDSPASQPSSAPNSVPRSTPSRVQPQPYHAHAQPLAHPNQQLDNATYSRHLPASASPMRPAAHPLHADTYETRDLAYRNTSPGEDIFDDFGGFGEDRFRGHQYGPIDYDAAGRPSPRSSPTHGAERGSVLNPSPTARSNWHASSAVANGAIAMPTLAHSHSAPPIEHHHPSHQTRARHSPLNRQQQHDDPHALAASHHQPPARHQSYDSAYCHPSVEDEIPPMPPVHRSSEPSPRWSGPTSTEMEDSIAPPPLSIPTHRSSMSPLRGPPASNSVYSPVSSHGQPVALSTSPTKSNYTQPRYQSEPPTMGLAAREKAMSMPPSLVAGHRPVRTSDAVDRVVQARRDMPSRRHEATYPGPSDGLPGHARYSHSPDERSPLEMTASVEVAGRRYHRASAPIIKPRAVSPDPRGPTRKSVSPQPSSVLGGSDERRLSGVPFSPDAYDALNPHAGSPGSSEVGSHHRASRSTRADSDARGNDEPIIGPDGQLIDPSDHLPTDTWAPEPERKVPAPSSGEGRARSSVLGAQPMPPSGRRPTRDIPARPISINGPLDFDPQTPSSTRNRLQKKPRAQMSTPALNTSRQAAAYDSHSVSPRAAPRLSAAGYPLREHENYGPITSPTHQGYGSARVRHAPAGPPPVPAKIAAGPGREDLSALSAELQSINIGGGGRRAVRRGQY
ncbi:MAG: hypothetical protein M1817_003448 [Caeruleum heppii]|nr:MAG: hypothetical protein M1817_003448 [Caeruleum heppii]